ncbi:hypothetical protein N0430_31390 [Pseudomonas aeruginosa]|nr:hypothetical protein [Pseudomonas aeruginosa]
MAVTLGSVQTVLVCVPGQGVQGFCPDGQSQTVTQAYMIAPSESTALDLMAQPFDASAAGAYFGFAFASTVFVYLLSLACGVLITTVKRA